MFNIRILPLLIVLALASCRKDELINKVTIDENPTVVLVVVSSFKGKIVDENGQPVEGAQVSVFQASTTTNQKGLFELKNIKAPKDAALVKVEKAGYFVASALSGNRAGGQQYVRITLLAKGSPKTVSADIGGTMTWPDGLKITIAPNSLRLPNGQAYTSLAQVSARWLDPTDPELGATMPGALMGRNEAGQEKVLATYGMITLDLKTGSRTKNFTWPTPAKSTKRSRAF